MLAPIWILNQESEILNLESAITSVRSAEEAAPTHTPLDPAFPRIIIIDRRQEHSRIHCR